ncbi:hypothetical protein CVT25_014575 [Psilocybe cyanescens]|uniref:Uncharacterized protein n=1 Tax=Psilocybe cyanescens TaxID=93625 RepID=A0A409WR79_PSICY|nr:hypothetical protein CVT25_014575 [Psilocybe cyanescens]
MTTSHITFPLELIEAFVEQLAPGNSIIREREIFQTLISCTLTSKYFSFAARKRLFSTLVVDRKPKYLLQKITSPSKNRTEEEISRRINSFIDLLTDERSSDLALMIRSLHIIVDRQRVMLQQVTNLHDLLRALSHRAHNLNVLRVHGRTFFSWTTIPQKTADGLQELRRSLPINRLSFSGIHDIPPIIASAQESPQLRYIDLEESKFAENDAGMAAETTISPASVTSGNLNLLGNLPTVGSYKIRYTSDGRTRIVGIDSTIQLFDDAQRLNQLLSDERVRSSLRYCNWTFSDTHEPFFTTKAIDFGTMVRLRKLSIVLCIGLYQRHGTTRDAITSEMRVDIYQRYEDITDAVNSLIDCLYYGNSKSALWAINITLNVKHVLYKGTSTFDPVDFSSLQKLRIDPLRKKHPLIQATQFCMNIGLMRDHSGPEVQLSVEKMLRKLITDAFRRRHLISMEHTLNADNKPQCSYSTLPPTLVNFALRKGFSMAARAS